METGYYGYVSVDRWVVRRISQGSFHVDDAESSLDLVDVSLFVFD
jgi:hypothetical protein